MPAKKKAAKFLDLPLIVAEALVKADKNDPAYQELRMELEKRVKLGEMMKAQQNAQAQYEQAAALAESHKAQKIDPEEEREQWRKHVKG